MNDITALAQRKKFQAWFANDVVGEEVKFPEFDGGEYTEGDLYDSQFYFMLQAMWMAWQAASVELVETLESRTVTVKLPRRVGAKSSWQDGPLMHADEVIAALAAAGIQVIEGDA